MFASVQWLTLTYITGSEYVWVNKNTNFPRCTSRELCGNWEVCAGGEGVVLELLSFCRGLVGTEANRAILTVYSRPLSVFLNPTELWNGFEDSVFLKFDTSIKKKQRQKTKNTPTKKKKKKKTRQIQHIWSLVYEVYMHVSCFCFCLFVGLFVWMFDWVFCLFDWGGSLKEIDR